MSRDARVLSLDQALARLVTLEDELASLRQELDHGHRLITIGTMAAGVAHEVNNLLTPALAYTQMAAAKPDDVALQRKALDKASSGIRDAAQILEAILDFCAPSSEEENADVNAALDGALELIARELEQNGAALERAIPPGAGAQIDPLALKQLFINLLGNAGRALGEGGGGQIRIAAEEATPSSLRITVSDTGPGIPGEVRSTLFQPFVSGDQRGHGLGLAICRRAVEAAGGEISLRETGPSGTVFDVVLPMAA